MRLATENPTSDSESASSTILVPQVSWKSLTFDKTAVIKSHRINPSDRHGNTPLVDAVRNKNFQCIEMMKNAGAQLKITDHHLANELCTLALFGDLDGITAWHMGGANLG